MAKRQLQVVSKIRRTASSFVRVPRNLPTRGTALIVCEDEKIAPHYFTALCKRLEISSASVRIPPNIGSAPISVVNFAEETFIRDGGYDRVFCVFDKDRHESYARAIQKVNGLASRLQSPMPIVAATAVPCFELWLLLHFERSDRPMRDSSEVVRMLGKHMPGYKKGDNKFTPEILDLTDAAIANSRWLIRRQSAAGTDNPSTKIHEVVSYLQELVVAK